MKSFKQFVRESVEPSIEEQYLEYAINYIMNEGYDYDAALDIFEELDDEDIEEILEAYINPHTGREDRKQPHTKWWMREPEPSVKSGKLAPLDKARKKASELKARGENKRAAKITNRFIKPTERSQQDQITAYHTARREMRQKKS